MSTTIPRRETPVGPRPYSRRRERGQAMLEYSVINWLLIVGLVMSSQVRMIPGPKDIHQGRMNITEAFLVAYQTYYDSYYFVLNMPFP